MCCKWPLSGTGWCHHRWWHIHEACSFLVPQLETMSLELNVPFLYVEVRAFNGRVGLLQSDQSAWVAVKISLWLESGCTLAHNGDEWNLWHWDDCRKMMESHSHLPWQKFRKYPNIFNAYYFLLPHTKLLPNQPYVLVQVCCNTTIKLWITVCTTYSSDRSSLSQTRTTGAIIASNGMIG